MFSFLESGLNILIQQVGFSCSPETYEDVIRLIAEREISVNQFVVRDGYLLLDDDIFDNLLVHTEIS